jgi:ABC-type multidrug transport system ATPase subunit
MSFSIELRGVGKRFRYEWIFKDIHQTFELGQSYAILGPNGAGKSTLMKILSGHLTPSVGQIVFSINGKKIDTDDIYHYISYAAPYIELIEEFSLREALSFHAQFHPFQQGLNVKKVLELLHFNATTAEKQIKFFSSGMKQRLKLALAMCSETPFVLLDEPTTNLDAQGFAWYRQLIDDFGKNRLIIVASNVAHDYDFCQQSISILDFK